MAFDKALERLRRKKGMQVPVLARQTGISQSRLKTFERGTENPTLTEVLALSYVLETSPTELEFMGNGAAYNDGAAYQETQAQAKDEWDNAVKWKDSNNAANPSQNQDQSPKAEPTTNTANESEQGVKPEVDETKEPKQDVKPAADTSQEPKQEAKPKTIHPNPKQSKAKVEPKPHQAATQMYQGQTEEEKILEEKKKSFGKMLRQARESRKIPYSKIKSELGIEIADYVRIEAGRELPSKELLEKIIKLFELKG